jgi:hypothetical protein
MCDKFTINKPLNKEQTETIENKFDFRFLSPLKRLTQEGFINKIESKPTNPQSNE